jgi:hypothetical protein
MDSTYEIGGLTIKMTPAAAARWNAGMATLNDLRSSRVHLPSEDREITLRRAVSDRLQPEVANQMFGMPANAIE